MSLLDPTDLIPENSSVKETEAQDKELSKTGT